MASFPRTEPEELYSAFMKWEQMHSLNSRAQPNESDNIQTRVTTSRVDNPKDGLMEIANALPKGGVDVDSPCVDRSPDRLPQVNLPVEMGQFSTRKLQKGTTMNRKDLKKMESAAKLSEIALTDPKRAKRILLNRESASRSKIRKRRYLSELEEKLKVVEDENFSLTRAMTLLQRERSLLNSQNSELRVRLQAMEEETKLREALNKALANEVQWLKGVIAGMDQLNSSTNLNQELQINFHMTQPQPRAGHQQQ